MRLVIALIALLSVAPAAAVAAPGDLDPTFGRRGWANLPGQSFAHAVTPFGDRLAVLASSPTVLDGRGRVARTATRRLRRGDRIVSTVAAPGRLIVLRSERGYRLERYTPSLRRDRDFATASSPGLAHAHMARDRYGRIWLAAGDRVIRHRPDGRRDTGFGRRGLLTLRDFAADDAVALGSGVLLDGYRRRGNDLLAPAVRLLDGRGHGPTLDLPGPASLFTVAAASQHRRGAVLARESSGLRASLLRLRPDGSVDTGFGDAGIATLPALGSAEYLRDVAVDRQGRVLAVHNDARGPVVFRLTPAGEPDRGFGLDGRVQLPVGRFGGTGRALAIDARGAILVAGAANTGPLRNEFREDFQPQVARVWRLKGR